MTPIGILRHRLAQQGMIDKVYCTVLAGRMQLQNFDSILLLQKLSGHIERALRPHRPVSAQVEPVDPHNALLPSGHIQERVHTGLGSKPPPEEIGIVFFRLVPIAQSCAAAVAAIKRELNSGWGALAAVVMQCCVAWIVAALVYWIGGLLI